jgi:carbon storage regulator
MLVLSRKTNESIQIGPDVKITVVRVSGDKVRIGIEAPRDVRVTRTELLPVTTEIEVTAADVSGDIQPG